ncbi:hypothetical protein FDA94_14485 [Herbidospora galbida]|uniref:Uncharacterized protein n=1 Tax=Herbidospora galbida TaxID=2575442 RepID=A0A4U3MFS3_9ACTN|nr:hypothetical protein [Herbidospora galbida]TKK88125.1 hypothetical protein FDA94_14485 [Herbidospora galbida]
MVTTSTTRPVRQPDLQEIRDHHAYLIRFADQPSVRPFVSALLTLPHGSAFAGVLIAVPDLCDEIERLHETLTALRLDHHNLIAAARATLAADHDGEPDPLYYVRDELSAQRGEAP